uniref:Putative secreted protein n=1 Tax=Panstrongylus lignarius TaxID=156445 RepID=A0A224XY33_9HEMI
MTYKQVLLLCLLAVTFTAAMNVEAPTRNKRETGSDALAKVEEAFQGFKENFNSLVTNISQSQFYKQFEKFGADLGEKGKELGAKIEETLSNLKQSASSS